MKIFPLLLVALVAFTSSFSQNVGINTNTPVTTLDVNSPSAFTTKFNGNSNQMYLGIYENNVQRGYIGSFSGAAEDVDLGTSAINSTGKVHLTIQAVPKMTVDNAGNVGIGTINPAATSILDLTSTTKGLLMPRMSSGQRTAISLPVTGLLVFDTDTKTLWAYDGSAWKNLSVAGGAFSLPFSQTVNMPTSALQVINQGMGAAIEATTSNDFGMGLYARASSEFGWGINAFSNRPGAVSIRSIADTGMVFYGENINTGNTNSLMSLLNRGLGKTLGLQLANTASTSPNLQVAGNNLGEQIKVFQTNASNSLPAVSINNSGTGEGLYSIANSGYGIKGETNSNTGFAGVHGSNTGTAGSGVVGVSNALNTQGVYGTSTHGIGVRATSTDNYAVKATSISGTGLYATSTYGFALEAVGNIKIWGGVTNPSDGAVLTSDASGIAVWKKKQVAFKAIDIPQPYHSAPSEVEWKILFSPGPHNYGNNFEAYTSGTPGLNSSTFIAPVIGLYHFDVSIDLQGLAFNDIEESYIVLRQQRGNTITDISKSSGVIIYHPSLIDHAQHKISTDVKLQAGDKLWVIVYQDSDLGDYALIRNSEFSGHLIFED